MNWNLKLKSLKWKLGMSKNKIEFGQCYSYHDHVYMIIKRFGKGWWVVQDTLSKKEYQIPEYTILTWRRPFPNFE